MQKDKLSSYSTFLWTSKSVICFVFKFVKSYGDVSSPLLSLARSTGKGFRCPPRLLGGLAGSQKAFLLVWLARLARLSPTHPPTHRSHSPASSVSGGPTKEIPTSVTDSLTKLQRHRRHNTRHVDVLVLGLSFDTKG